MLLQSQLNSASHKCSSSHGLPRLQPVRVAAEPRQHTEVPTSSTVGPFDLWHGHVTWREPTTSPVDEAAFAATVSDSHIQQQVAAVQPQQAHVEIQQQEYVAKQQHQVRKRPQHKQLATIQQARQLTTVITSSQDVTQLLLVLVQHMPQLDHIHTSAAVKQACRVLQLDLTLPEAAGGQQSLATRQQSQPQQHMQQASALQWLQQLDLSHVQLRVQQHQLHVASQDIMQEQAQQHWHVDRHGNSTISDSNVQQHPQLQWVIEQQHAPQAIVHRELAAALQQQQHNEDPQQLPSDSWLLLLLLSQLVVQHSSTMASQQLCTCINGLTHLLLLHPALPLLGLALYRSALQQLLQASCQQMHSFDSRALSVLLHAAAAIARAPLGLAPSTLFCNRWFKRSRQVMAQFSPLDFAMSGWAVGRLGVYPPTQWMTDFFAHSKAAIQALQPNELILLLLGVADTERTPRRSTAATAARAGWAQAAAKQLQPHLHMLSPKQLSGAALAFAKLHYRPSQQWLAAFTKAWEAQQSDFSAKGHSMVLWGVGSMSHTEQHSQEARAVLARKIQAALQQAVSRAATAVAAVALLKLRQAKQQQQQLSEQQQVQLALPEEQLQQQALAQPLVQQPQQQQQCGVVLQEQPQLLCSASLLHPTDCAMVVYALARMGPNCIDAEFASFWLRQSKSQLGNMNSQELASCVWALGRLGLRPPEDWLQQHLACCAQLAPCMSHQQLVMLLWGLAKLQYRPDVLVTAELLMSAAEQLPSFSSHSLSLMVHSLGCLKLKPNKEWMALVLQQAQKLFMRCDGQDLCGLVLGLYKLRYNPDQRWLDAFVQTMAAKVHLVPARKYALIVAVLHAMGYSCKGRPFAWVLDQAAVAAMCNRDVMKSKTGTEAGISSSSVTS